MTWAFVLNAVGLREDQGLGRDLAERGLAWWGREIRVSNAGTRMFLYSLMAEGGIPEALLKSPGLYRDVVLGLLTEIEREGGQAARSWAELISARWVVRLPQTFRGPDIARLLADLALSLADLRAELPADLPEAAADQWLNKHKRGWLSRLPLRMTPEIAETLIRPALRAERDPLSTALGPLCRRELRRDGAGKWHGYLVPDDDGWLPVELYPDAKGLRLRLLPAGATRIQGLIYTAAPEEAGWRLRRFGGAGFSPTLLSPHEPFALTALADGRLVGEAVVDPGVPAPDEAPTFWRAADPTESAEAERLIPLSGAGRTRSACLWLLAPENMELDGDTGVAFEELETAPEGLLWRLSGKGTIEIGERRYRIETRSEDDAPEARLTAVGEVLRGWRLGGSAPVHRGQMTFFGQHGASRLRHIPERELRRSRGRFLYGELVEWVSEDEVLATIRLVRLPKTARLAVREDAPSRVTFEAEGLESGWRVGLAAGGTEQWGDLNDGSVRLTLDAPGMAPGLVCLRLSDPATGASLELQTPWPARRGMILDPEGVRLDRNQPISVGALHGWRVVAPQGAHGDFQLRLKEQSAISLPVAGEASLTGHLPLIQAMLAQGGPDAQVNLRLVVGGDEGHRLEVRRYHDRAVVEDGVLRAGLGRDRPITSETALAAQFRKFRRLAIHAVDMSSPERIETIEAADSPDLRTLLGDEGGPWMIHPRLEGRVQRAVVWIPDPVPQTSRDDRIKTLAEEWRRLVSAPEDSEWDRLWQLISNVRQGGDPGVLDEVQALALAPTAAVSLALRVPRREIFEVRALDAAAPIFWPVVSVVDFTQALGVDHERRVATMRRFFDEWEAEEEADAALAKRIGEILTLMPELAGHFGAALANLGLLGRIVRSPDHQEMLRPLLISDPAARLAELAQEAVRRFDRLPVGVRGLVPQRPPERVDFNPYAQPVIDAPIVAAEMAAGQRPSPRVAEKLTLINLRLVDPIFFDAALPVALALYFTERRS